MYAQVPLKSRSYLFGYDDAVTFSMMMMMFVTEDRKMVCSTREDSLADTSASTEAAAGIT